MKVSALELIGAVAVAAATYMVTDDPVAVASALALLCGVKLLTTGDGLVVLALAFAFQWMQVSIGLFYPALTGRELLTTSECDYRPMVLLGLGCILALAIG